MGDYYLTLIELAEAEANAYNSGDRYDYSEDDLNDWFSGSAPWEEPEGYDIPF